MAPSARIAGHAHVRGPGFDPDNPGPVRELHGLASWRLQVRETRGPGEGKTGQSRHESQSLPAPELPCRRKARREEQKGAPTGSLEMPKCNATVLSRLP